MSSPALEVVLLRNGLDTPSPVSISPHRCALLLLVSSIPISRRTRHGCHQARVSSDQRHALGSTVTISTQLCRSRCLATARRASHSALAVKQVRLRRCTSPLVPGSGRGGSGLRRVALRAVQRRVAPQSGHVFTVTTRKGNALEHTQQNVRRVVSGTG